MKADYRESIQKYLPDQNEKDKLKSVSSTALDFINSYCKNSEIAADAVLVGSVAKGTNLKGADIDLFVRFDKSYSRKEMEQLGLEIGHKTLSNGQEKYAEHPYVTGFHDGVKIDVVPCYRIQEGQKKLSSVDRTPLHTDYVKRSLDQNGISEVLLLKVFAKSIGVYGSEVTISGFSGYICELLVISYGTFEEVVRTFASCRGKFYLGSTAFSKKFREQVVIVDPVDEDRNAAAAISLENLSRMKVACKMFLRSQSASFLSLEEKPLEFKRDDRGTEIRIFSVPRPDQIDDVVYPQALRMRNSIWSILESEGFEPLDSEVEVSSKVRVLIECRRMSPPKFILHQGPPADSDNALDFIEKWKDRDILRGPYIRDDRLYVDLKGKPKSIEDVLPSQIGALNIGKSLNQFKGDLEIEKPDLKSHDTLLEKFLSRGLF